MRIFSVANLKGGVGKTTTAVALAGLLAERGFQTLLVDLDPQASATAYFGVEPERCIDGVVRWFHRDALANPAQVLPVCADLRSLGDRLWLMPSTPSLAKVERLIAQPNGVGNVLQTMLARQASRFQFVIVDTSPAIGVLLVNALVASEQLIVPVQCEPLAIEGLKRLDSTLSMIRRSRGTAVSRLIVPTMVDFRTRASPASLAELRRCWFDELWRAFIPEDTTLKHAAAAKIPPACYAPRARAVAAYRMLLDELLVLPGAEQEASASWRSELPVL